MKYAKPRGTQDILPPDVHAWRYAERVFEATLERFGYEPVRTPIFESTDLFLRSVGEGTDIVSKEMYTFSDRGGRSLTLRPENTASVIRAYLEAGLHRAGGVTRLFYFGPMFRYDRPQAGRYRQFHQVGAEAIGSSSAMVDVEIIDIVMTSLETMGFEGLHVVVNSVGHSGCRAAYIAVLRAALEKHASRLCDDCRQRAITNPLRVFDCKTCVDVKAELPPISQHLCGECSAHFERVKSHLRAIGRLFEEDAQLVRGLDYYTKTTFEILHGDLGAQNALCGGGRYDDLVEQCGGPSTPAVGFSAGLERIISVLPDRDRVQSETRPTIDVYVACVDEGAERRALVAARTLRSFGSVRMDATLRSLKKQLKAAEKSNARFAVIVESAGDSLKWKDMASREQFEIADGDLAPFASEKFRPRGRVNDGH